MKHQKKIILHFTVLLFALMLTSCATTVKVNLTRPAQLDLNGAHTISVLPFKPYYYYKTYEASIGKQIVINTFYQIFDIRDPDEQLSMDCLKNQIEKGLLDSPYIKLVSSDSVERSLKNGTLNPADVYLTGEVSYFNISDINEEKKRLVSAATDTEPAQYQYFYIWRREVTFNFKYQLVDSSTDKIISFNEFRISKVSSEYETRRMLPSGYSIIESDIKSAAKSILRQLQPYTVTKSITLLETKTKDKVLKEQMKAADDLADNGMISQSYDAFMKIYEETELVEAGYNAAMLLEAMGKLSDAESLMQSVYQKHPDTRVAKGLADIQNEINLASRLKKQIKATEDSKASGDLDAIDDDDGEDLGLDF